jgi:hypothetical protein
MLPSTHSLAVRLLLLLLLLQQQLALGPGGIWT